MKALMSVLALSFTVAFIAPALAADPPKTKADCEKMKMIWDDATKTCVEAKK
ncbi:MAG TPA: hypothetical protein VIG38_05070 [Hyphomicrobium sp.]|jgi:hypothetical protein